MNAPPSAPRRVDESMTLLTEILERPLDPAYGALARRRVAAGLPASRGSRSALFVVTLVVQGGTEHACIEGADAQFDPGAVAVGGAGAAVVGLERLQRRGIVARDPARGLPRPALDSDG